MTTNRVATPPDILDRRYDDGSALPRIGVVDIGSNSVRLVIYERYGASTTPVYNEKLLAGLGRDLKSTGKLYPQGVAQTLKALVRFQALAKAHKLDSLSVVATAAIRQASDGSLFCERVKAQTGLDIRILSGADEAMMSAYGVISGEKRADGIVADLGGASLELVSVKESKVGNGKTFALGPFVMMSADKSGPESGFDPGALSKKVGDTLSAYSKTFSAKSKTLYLVGGAWRNLIWIDNRRRRYPLNILHNYEMRPESAMQLARWASGEAAKDLLSWPGISPSRAETLPYSGIVLESLVSLLKPSKVVISPTGLREGLLYLTLPDSVKSNEPLFDACRHLAMGNAQGLDFGTPLHDWLAPAARKFPRAFDEISEMRLRRAACLLVGMGKGLHPDHRADLVFDDVLYAPLSGLTHKERAYLALMLYSSYRSGKITPNNAAIDYHLLEREKNSARIYGSAMRLGSIISSRSAELLDHFELLANETEVSLIVKDGKEALLNRRGILRLTKLADLLSLRTHTNWVKAGEK